MKLLFIEPHPDDAVLSSYYQLLKFKFDYDIYLVSVSNHPWIKRSSKSFCKFIGISHIDIEPVLDLDYSQCKIPVPFLKKQLNPYKYQCEYYLSKYTDTFDKVSDLVNQVLINVKPDLIITALGIHHPMHVITRHAVDGVTKGIPKEYFVDMPYRFKRYGQMILTDSGATLKSSIGPFEEDEVKIKLNTFIKHYPTEANLLRFERDNFTTHIEEMMEYNEIHSSIGHTHTSLDSVLKNI